MRRAPIAIAVAAAVALVVSGCGPGAPVPTVTVTVTVTPDPVADSPRESEASALAKQSTCALGEAGILLIVAGGTAAQAVAELVAVHADDPRIRELAGHVRDGSDTSAVRQELAERLETYCETG